MKAIIRTFQAAALQSAVLQAAVLLMLGSAGAQAANYQIETWVDGLENPYSLAFLPDGGLLISEKSGALRLVRDGRLLPQPIATLPDTYSQRQGGFSDVVPHPDFADNRLVYMAYSAGDDHANTTRVMRARLEGDRLADLEEVYRARPDKGTGIHFGGRLAFLPDNTLLITVGDRGSYREQAQDPGDSLGSVLRVTDDGGIPGDNPFLGRDDTLPEMWSYGHRNAQGLLVDRETGRVYSTEHGPRGGDELNLIEPGNNYGWPLATHGIDYTGVKITPYTEYPGTVQPLLHWTPSLAPSGLAQCRGCLWPRWEGNLFAGQLRARRVQRIELENGVVVGEESLFEDVGERIRDVRFGPDGALYLVTDNRQGRVLRVTPVE